MTSFCLSLPPPKLTPHHPTPQGGGHDHGLGQTGPYIYICNLKELYILRCLGSAPLGRKKDHSLAVFMAAGAVVVA